MEQLDIQNLKIGNVILRKSGEEMEIKSEHDIDEISKSSEDFMGIQITEDDFLKYGFEKMGGDDYYYVLEINDHELETSEKSMHFLPIDVDGLTVLINYRHELENLIKEVEED